MLGFASIIRRIFVRSLGAFGFFISCNPLRYFGFDDGLSSNGAFATTSLGSLAIVFVSTFTCIILSSFTLPMTEYGTWNFSQICFSNWRLYRSVITSILSWDSEIIISVGDIPVSLLCTRATSNSIPTERASAVSDIAHERPPPPKSFIAFMQPLSRASSIASITSFSIKGSGIWTAERFSDSKVSDANCDPPIPSRPVEPPIKTTKSSLSALFLISLFFFPKPIAATSTSA